MIYSDGRTPRLSPGYDFVSTIRYIEDRKVALSMAREKDTKYLDTDLLESFVARACVPSRMVLDTALETAARTVKAWSELNADLPIDREMRKKNRGPTEVRTSHAPVSQTNGTGAAPELTSADEASSSDSAEVQVIRSLTLRCEKRSLWRRR
jgi:hypothetical protein